MKVPSRGLVLKSAEKQETTGLMPEEVHTSILNTSIMENGLAVSLITIQSFLNIGNI